MALIKRNKTYHVYFVGEGGKVVWRSTGTGDLNLARQVEQRYMDANRAKKGAKRFMRTFPELTSSAPPVQQLLPDEGEHKRGGIAIAKMWDLALTRRPLSSSHAQLWGAFVRRCPVKYADQVTPKVALNYLNTCYSSGNGKTYNNAKTVLNTIFRCCLVEAGLKESPFAAIINKRIEKIDTPRNLTSEEFALLCQSAPLHLRIMCMLSRWTCQRLETCARMTPEMFNLQRLVFTIEPGKTARYKKWVCVPIMPELEAFLRPILPKCKPGKPIIRNFTDGKG